MPPGGVAEVPKPRYSLQKEVVKGRGPECRLYLYDSKSKSRLFLGQYGDLDIQSDWVQVKGRFLVAGLGDRLSNKKLFLYDLSKKKVILGQSLNPAKFVDTAPNEHAFFSNGVFCRVTTGKGEEWLVWKSTGDVVIAKPPGFLRGLKRTQSTDAGLKFYKDGEALIINSLPKFEQGKWKISLTVAP